MNSPPAWRDRAGQLTLGARLTRWSQGSIVQVDPPASGWADRVTEITVMPPAAFLARRGQHALKLERLIPAGQKDFELPVCEPCREAAEDPGAVGHADDGKWRQLR